MCAFSQIIQQLKLEFILAYYYAILVLISKHYR